MSETSYILDEREPVSGAFLAALGLHVAVIGGLTLFAWVTKPETMGAPNAGGAAVGVEAVKNGTPAENAPAPRSDTPTETAAPAADNSAGAQPSASELTPNVPADANELKPNVSSSAQDDANAPPPPQQVNEIGSTPTDQKTAEAAAPDPDEGPGGVSSSKKKKKKGLKKLIPF